VATFTNEQKLCRSALEQCIYAVYDDKEAFTKTTNKIKKLKCDTIIWKQRSEKRKKWYFSTVSFKRQKLKLHDHTKEGIALLMFDTKGLVLHNVVSPIHGNFLDKKPIQKQKIKIETNKQIYIRKFATKIKTPMFKTNRHKRRENNKHQTSICAWNVSCCYF
jgi:hypothetical protein